MTIPGITWRGESPDDIEHLRDLPPELVRLLAEVNGFILHRGALHVRGAIEQPPRHSLRAAMQAPEAIHALYDEVMPTDVPFAQDQMGDQFLLREGQVLRLSAEAGELEAVADSLDEFMHRVSEDVENFLNASLDHTLQPGQLLLTYPPFVFQESASGSTMKPLPAHEVIRFHADLARRLKDVEEGGQIEFRVVE